MPPIGESPPSSFDRRPRVDAESVTSAEVRNVTLRCEDSIESCVEGGRMAFMGLIFGALWGVSGCFRAISGFFQSLFFGTRASEIEPLVSEEQVGMANRAVHQCFDGILSFMQWGVHSILGSARDVEE